MVGPFIFFDHMGPAELGPDKGINVRPHPHVNLATVTYLFQGEIVHRDSLGSDQTIRPGAINWMTAGSGITHSERTGPEERARAGVLQGIQLWVALPKEHEETEPDFHHHPGASLPEIEQEGVRLRVLAGEAYGATSPVRTFSPLFYVEATMDEGSMLSLPDEYAERAMYLVDGHVRVGNEPCDKPQMLVFGKGSNPKLMAERESKVVLIGGEPLEGKRHIWWNFVSSSKERIEQAKRDWEQDRFPKIPGDDQERIPLP